MAIVINGSGTVTGLSVGGLPDGTVDSGTLATDSVTAAKIAADSVDSAELIDGAVDDSHMASISGRKNMVYNGAMQVAQRGTTAALNSAASTYQLDRWNFYWRTGPAATVTQSTDVPSGGGFAYSQKIDVTTGDAMGTANDLAKFCQKLEGINLQHLAYGTSSAKSLTLSFWIKSTITGTYFVQLNGLDANRFNTVSYTVNSSNTWEKKTVTFSGDTSSTIQNTTGNDLELRFWLALGPDYKQSTTPINTWTAGSTNWGTGQVNAINSASNNIYFTGVQLEVGSVATDFEHRSYGEELALCQRYYQILVDGGADKAIGMGFYWSSTEIDYTHRFVTEMRASPTLDQVVGTDYYRMSSNNDSFNGFGGIQYTSTRSCNMYCSANVSGTTGYASDLRTRNADSFIAFTAEL